MTQMKRYYKITFTPTKDIKSVKGKVFRRGKTYTIRRKLTTDLNGWVKNANIKQVIQT